MPREADKQQKAQETSVQPLAINYDRFKDDEIMDCSMRHALNSAWRAFDGIAAIVRILEANHTEQIAQDTPLALDNRTVTGLLSAVVALAELGRGQMDDYGEEVHKMELHRTAEGRAK